MPILEPSTENIQKMAELIQRGDVVGMPTETVYGLAGCCFNESALQKIYQTKQRPPTDPLIVHICDLRQLELVCVISESQREIAAALMESFWPGPLTLVFQKAPGIPLLCTAGQETVGVRFPSHAVARKLIELAGCPLAAPSANLFGHVSPTKSQHVQDDFPDVNVLNGDQSEIGVESTVLQILENKTVKIFRRGFVTESDIEKLFKNGVKIEVQKISSSVLEKSFEAPGLFLKHYALENCVTAFLADDCEQLGQYQNSAQIEFLVEKFQKIAILNTCPQFKDIAIKELVLKLKIKENQLTVMQIWDNANFKYFDALRFLEQLKMEALIIIPPCSLKQQLQNLNATLFDKIFRSSQGQYLIVE